MNKNSYILLFLFTIVINFSCKKSAIPPSIKTLEVSNIFAKEVQSGGIISSEGSSKVTSRGVVWSTTQNPTISLTTKSTDSSGIGTYTSKITGLSANNKYYIRAYATNESGTFYGNEVTFNTNDIDISTGMVAFYPFTNNSLDSSGNNFHGTVNGAILTTDRFNNPNKAYSFNNAENNFIDISAHNFNISGNTSRTIACWVYPLQGGNVFASGNEVRPSTKLPQSTTFNLRITPFSNPPNTYSLSFMGYEDDINSNEPAVLSEKWIHVAITYSNNIVTLFVNGIKGTSKTTTLKTLGNSNFIGKSNHVTVESYYKGKIDEVRVYNRALSQNEINYLATH